MFSPGADRPHWGTDWESRGFLHLDNAGPNKMVLGVRKVTEWYHTSPFPAPPLMGGASIHHGDEGCCEGGFG